MKNRREFIVNTAATALSAMMGNPVVLLGQESANPTITLFIFFRGGSDGLAMFPPDPNNQENSALINFLRGGYGTRRSEAFKRPDLLIPDQTSNSNPYSAQDIFSLGGGSQLGLHPAWSRLAKPRSSNSSNRNNPIQPLTVNGRSLTDYLVFRLLKGVGMLHFYENTTLRNIRINKSHFDTQSMALLASTSAASGTGFLARSVYFNPGCTNDNLSSKLRLVAFNTFSNNELGVINNCGEIVRIPGSFKAFEESYPATHPGFPRAGCTSYQDTERRIYNRSSAQEELGNLINELRNTAEADLALRIKESYEQASTFHSFFSNLNSSNLLRLSSEEDQQDIINRFRGMEYVRNNDVWEGRFRNQNSITNQFMNICSFILSSDSNNFPRNNVTIALSIGGFDTHANQLRDLPGLIADVAGGLHGLFYTILNKKPALMDRLSVYIMTEFGRTIRQNFAQSTDHGWGNILFAIFGRSTPLNDNQRLDREVGPTLSVTGSDGVAESTLNTQAYDYARYIEATHLDLDPMHIYPKVSMHSGLALLLSRALGINASRLETFLDQTMDHRFYKRNFILDGDQKVLWTQFLEGIPFWDPRV